MNYKITVKVPDSIPVGVPVTLRAKVEPPVPVTAWTGDLGLNHMLSADGTVLRTVWGTAGPKWLWVGPVNAWDQAKLIDIDVGPSHTIPTPTPGPPPPYGYGERVPDVVFVARQPGAGAAFLETATKYHQEWQLKPIRVTSLADVVAHLAKTPSKPHRIRLVLHAFRAEEHKESGVTLALFRNGGEDFVGRSLLLAWAESDAAGLSELCRAQVGDDKVLPGLIDLSHEVQPQHGEMATLLKHTLDTLRSDYPGVLTAFGMEDSDKAKPVTLQLIQRSLDLKMVTQWMPASRLTKAVKRALDVVLRDLRSKVAAEGVSVSAGIALQDAILGVKLPFSTELHPKKEEVFVKNVEAANIAVKGDFRGRLKAARKRLTANAWIDIRGCQVGGDERYLKALQTFFGSYGKGPHVSAPDWFQGFWGPPASVNAAVPSLVAWEKVTNKPAATAIIGHWIEVVGLLSLKKQKPGVQISAYLDMNYVLPTPLQSGHIMLYHIPGESRLRWLRSQWTPPLAKPAKALAAKWTSSGKPPTLCTLSHELQDSPTQRTYTVPDPEYQQHIKQI